MADLVPNQIKTIGASKVVYANNTLSSKSEYLCANADITRGITHQPTSLSECFSRFPNISAIASQLNVSSTPWTGPATPTGTPPVIFDPLLGITAEECEKVRTTSGLGASWLGCLWGSPMAPFSCTCPDIGSDYLNYLKLRLSVATFWNTPVTVPPQRNEFLDSLEYSKKVTITVAGNFDIKPGNVVELRVNNMAAYPALAGTKSLLTDKYYVLSVKHTITNGGVHETNLTICRILENELGTP
jgi:hypothetical protein